MMDISSVQNASQHPKNSTVHTSAVTQSLYILQVTLHIALTWFCISVRKTLLSKQQTGYEIANDHMAFRMVKENVLLNFCCQ